MTDERQAKLEQRIAKIEADLRKKQKIEEKLLEFASDATKFEEVIKAQEARFTELSNRLQSYINRECVLTEVSRFVRSKGSADLIVKFHLQLMKAYNWDDTFWEQRGSGTFTIGEWFDKIMNVDSPTPMQESEMMP